MRTRKEIEEGLPSMATRLDLIPIELLLDIRELLQKNSKGRK